LNRRRLKPKNDFIFKSNLKDKTGRLDIRAETVDGVQIDIEMQLTDEKNMDRRTLFYFGKLFLESIKAGDAYQDLKRTVTINILDFTFLDIERFHSTFHLYEDHEKDYMLTDVMEIHFIEYPKFREARHDLNDPLHRWLRFMEEKLSEDELKELIEMDPIIKKAEERLEWLSSDEETLKLYEFRENSRIEKNSLIRSAKEEGKKEVAKNLLREGIDPLKVVEVTGLSIEEVRKLAAD
jgi:predicted transposase/invertase (TIGR01784 family)